MAGLVINNYGHPGNSASLAYVNCSGSALHPKRSYTSNTQQNIHDGYGYSQTMFPEEGQEALRDGEPFQECHQRIQGEYHD